MPTLLFTKREADILRHRLEIPDALADAMEEEFPRGDVEGAARKLCTQVSQRFAGVETEIDRVVLIDALEGTTFLTYDDVDNGKMTPQAHAALMRVAHGLAEKLSRVFGVKVTVPSS